MFTEIVLPVLLNTRASLESVGIVELEFEKLIIEPSKAPSDMPSRPLAVFTGL